MSVCFLKSGPFFNVENNLRLIISFITLNFPLVKFNFYSLRESIRKILQKYKTLSW